MNNHQKIQFKNFFTSFVFGEANSYEMLESFYSIPNVKEKLVQKDILQRRKHTNLTHKEQMQINVIRYTEVFKLSKQSKNPQFVFRSPDFLVQLYGFVLNTGAFLSTIELLGDQNQINKWRDLVLKGKVIGGYGQTELGHGSNVQMLQTQALYDEQRGTFIINTPKNTSTKFWPGCFGIFSTHCVLQANTIVKNEKIGIQTFIVPMRDQYLNPLIGIQSGDIGPKIGFLKVDNGYLKLNNVEIPRQNMLSKYVQILGDGTVVGLQNKQAIKYGYGSMLNLRIKLVIGFALAYIYAPGTIQYDINQKNSRISQPLIKKRLLQTMCIGLGTVFSNAYVMKLFKKFLDNLQSKNYAKADKLLIVCHIFSSTFKALSSWKSQEVLRQYVTMNSFGSFQLTYLPKYLTDCIPSVTYEGDNTVLLQQTAKFILMKQQDDLLTKPQEEVDSNNLSQVLEVFKYISSCEIRNLKELIQKSVEGGKDFKVIWNEQYQQKIIEVSKLWGRMTLIMTSMQTLKQIKQYKQFFEKIVRVFASTLINQTKEMVFYGFRLSQSTAWKQFTVDQVDVLKDLNRPVRRQYEPYNYESRGSPNVSDWIYSKL